MLFYGAPDKTESESRFELLYKNYRHPMQQAAFGILRDRENELKAQTDYEYQFSERFEENMEKLIRKVERHMQSE